PRWTSDRPRARLSRRRRRACGRAGFAREQSAVRFEPFADDVRADPYPHYARLRAEDPVHWSEKLRAWAGFRYDDGTAVLADDTRFSADRGRARRGEQAFAADRAVALRIVSADPPVCTVPRAVLNACLVARVRALRPRIDAIVADLLDALART